MAMTGFIRMGIGICAVLGSLAYLRDPPWLLSYTHGLRDWEVDAEERRVRWTGGRAAFHVPSDLRSVTIPLRSVKLTPEDRPITALVSIDDRPAERVTFTDDSWRLLTIRLPPKGSRRARRIDIKLDRVRPGNLGLQMGELQFFH